MGFLTKEKVQSAERIAMSKGDVWFATQKPEPFGLYSVLWDVITADKERVIRRKVILKDKSAQGCRRNSKGIIATRLLVTTATYT